MLATITPDFSKCSSKVRSAATRRTASNLATRPVTTGSRKRRQSERSADATSPGGAVIIPIPTSRPHIRQRGFDHTALLARHLAKLKSCQTSPILTRRTNSTQFGSTRTQRLAQAQEAFSCQPRLNPKTHYILLDDIYTSGASIHAAADLLRTSGARKISVIIIARQPDSASSKPPK